MMDKNILIVEDEKRVAGLLNDYMKKSGYQTHMIHNGGEVIPYIKKTPSDLILLDLMLPEKDGLEIVRELREFSQIPVIMITARIEEIDRLLGLALGADDYICKPFSFREVVARVKAVLRRTSIQPSEVPSGAIVLYESKHLAVILDKKLELTAIEFQLLKVLSEHPGIIFSRDCLMDHIYPDGRVVSDRTIDSHIRKLRKKMDDLVPGNDMIKSIYSVGYKFDYPE